MLMRWIRNSSNIVSFFPLILVSFWLTPAKAEGIIFRNKEFGVRFVYPDNWIEKAPRGLNVRALVDAPDGTGNCVLVVRRDSRISQISQQEIDAEMFTAPMSEAAWRETLGKRYADTTQITDRKLTKVDNQLAQFAHSKMAYTTVAGTFHTEGVQFITMTPGLFWNFVCIAGGTTIAAAEANFKKNIQSFIGILTTFGFETKQK